MKDFQFSGVFDNSPVIMLLIDPQSGFIVDSNEAAQQFYGYDNIEFSHLRILDINILPENKKLEILKKSKEGDVSNATYQHKIRTGVVKDIHALTFPVTVNTSKLILAIIEDVTEYKSLEEELNKFNSITDNSPAYVGMIGLDRRVLYMNKEMRREFAVPDNVDLSTYSNTDFYSARGLELIQSLGESLSLMGYWYGENEMRTLDGTTIPVMQSIVIIKDISGNPLYYSMTAINITTQKAYESKISESEENLKMSEVIGKLGYFSYDLKSLVYTFSEGGMKLYGLKQASASKEEIESFRLPQFSQKINEAISKLLVDKETFKLDYQIRRKSDQQIIDLHAIVKYDEEKRRIFGSIKDISEPKNWEREAIKLQHELRGLTGRLQFLRTEERNSLAIAVHDKIGQQLVALRFQMERLSKEVNGEQPQLQTTIDSLLTAVKEMIKDFMMLYAEVKPVFLKYLPLEETINDVCKISSQPGNFKLHYFSSIEQSKFDSSIELIVLKIVEVCMDNIVKHASATDVFVDLTMMDSVLNLIIRDNGVGFSDTNAQPGQFGFLEIRELLNSIGGKLKINTQIKKGTTVEIWVPV